LIGDRICNIEFKPGRWQAVSDEELGDPLEGDRARMNKEREARGLKPR